MATGNYLQAEKTIRTHHAEFARQAPVLAKAKTRQPAPRSRLTGMSWDSLPTATQTCTGQDEEYERSTAFRSIPALANSSIWTGNPKAGAATRASLIDGSREPAVRYISRTEQPI